MASIAHAAATSISGAANQGGSDSVAVTAATLPVAVPVSAANRPQDTVNLTETGARNVAVAAQSGKRQSAFQATYFPPSSAPGTKVAHASGGATQSTVVTAETNNPTAQVANAAAEAAGGATSAITAAGLAARSGGTSSPSQNSLLSAASQAKLAQLDQVLQQMGINPTQISFADRIALLPLVNDPAAIQQYIQGLPTQTAVLSPATSQVLAPAVVSPSGTTQTGASSVAGSASGSAASTAQFSSASTGGGASPANGSAAAAFQPGTSSFVGAVTGATRGSDTTGQKVNISV
jgi:hypothetical protein